MRFNLDDYGPNHVMHCKTEEEATFFCNYLHDQGLKWSSGNSYKGRTLWGWSGNSPDDRGYRFKCGTSDRMEYYENVGIEKFIILEFDDFEWNDDHSVDTTTPSLIDFNEIVF